MSSQLALPLPSVRSFSRDDFIVASGNAQAVSLIDAWPAWPVRAAAIHGPPGSGKTHLAHIWCECSGALLVPAAALKEFQPEAAPLVVEDVDSEPASEARDRVLFRLIEGASLEAPVLLTGRNAPSRWPTVLPDLASRFSALLSLPVWVPDDALLARLAHKLLADRQLSVPDAVVQHMLNALERNPGAIRAFIARADAKALAESRPVSLALVREMIAEGEANMS